jgi:hypothetical protein
VSAGRCGDLFRGAAQGREDVSARDLRVVPPDVRSGGLLIATAAIREDGITDRLFRRHGRPSATETRALIESARANPEVTFGTGVIMTTAKFYRRHPESEVAGAARDRWRDGAGRAGRDQRLAASVGDLTVDATMRRART